MISLDVDWDAIVVGAGPAGSVAARQLASRGRRVLLLDKKPFPRRKVCGACLNAASLRAFESLGLLDRVQELQGPNLERLDVRAHGRRAVLSLPNGLAVSRAALDDMLAHEAMQAGAVFVSGVTASVAGLVENRRVVIVTSGASETTTQMAAKVVLAADGLGHSSLSGVTSIGEQTARTSRIGLGCCVREFPKEYAQGTIFMAVARGGYVGLVRVETGELNLAAALDGEFIREQSGPANAAVRVLHQAGFPAIDSLREAVWIGTPALTRRTKPVAAERLFVLGDATGYVEPFTGEGIAWAITSAIALSPMADSAIHEWQPELAQRWCKDHSRRAGSQQVVCRGIAWLLRRPACVRAAIGVLSHWPSLARPFVSQVNAGACSTRINQTAPVSAVVQ